MKLAVNMITYNGASSFIEKAIESVLPYVNEINIIDTGSTDDTKLILKKYKINLSIVDLTQFGDVWTNSQRDEYITDCLNMVKESTKADWILRIDDDEIWPSDTMEYIINMEKDKKIYSFPFLHFETKNRIVDPKKHPNMYASRLFKNIPEITWTGRFAKEALTYKGKRVSATGKPKDICQRVSVPFLHLGEIRNEERKWLYGKHLGERYRFHQQGHCGLSVPEKYKKYVS